MQTTGQGIEVLAPTTAVAMHTAEVESAVDIANRFPRNLTDFKENLRALASKNQPTAQSMEYRLKRGGKTIAGPSIRFAELLRLTYKNIRVSCDIIDETSNEVVARCIGHDMESNIWESSVVSRSIVGRNGRYSTDMIMQTKNAAISIVKRNVLVSLIPEALWSDVYKQVQDVAIGSKKGFVESRDTMLRQFAEMDVSVDLVLAYIGKQSVESIVRSDLVDMAGVITAINDHTTTIDEVFRADAREATRRQADDITTAGTTTEAKQSELAAPAAAAAEAPPTVAPAGDTSAVSTSDEPRAEQPSEDSPAVMDADGEAVKTATISRVASLLRGSGLSAPNKSKLLQACFGVKSSSAVKLLDVGLINKGGQMMHSFFAAPDTFQQAAIDSDDIAGSIDELPQPEPEDTELPFLS